MLATETAEAEVGWFDDATGETPDLPAMRIHRVLDVIQAQQKLLASAQDTIAGVSGITVIRLPWQHAVLAVFLDRACGSNGSVAERMRAELSQAAFGVYRTELACVDDDQLAELLGQRLDKALSRFRPVRLADIDSDEAVSKEVEDSIRDNPAFPY